jgi:dihydrofolate reductase
LTRPPSNQPEPAPVRARRFGAVVAACENNVIGDTGRLPWKLPADLKRFRRVTMGHHLIMGRRTLESIGRLLPGRKTVVLTRTMHWRFPGAMIAHSLAEADRLTSNDLRPMVVGGGEIYSLFWPFVQELYFTRVHTQSTGDTFLPVIDWSEWELADEQSSPADGQNQFACSFQHWLRRPPQD